MTLSTGSLTELAVSYLERQGWYQQATAELLPAPVELLACDVLRDEMPGLARLLLGRGERSFQLLVGWREATAVAEVLKGSESPLLGSLADGEASALVYDALADDELLLHLLELVTDGAERAERVRRVSTLVSHASLVFDERLFMKCYRVLEPGERPEVEMMFRLDTVGFNALLAPVARWRAHGYDLALVREFLPSALEGRPLALTSLRDLLAQSSGVEERANALGSSVRDLDAEAAAAGGDFASEMRRLGATTAGMHAALSTAFGTEPADPADLAALIAEVGGPALDKLARSVASLEQGTVGEMTRIHGDFHLRRVLRSEVGWLVAGFGDDPLYAMARPAVHPSLAPRIGSPVEDLADMCFSLRRVGEEAIAKRPQAESERAAALAAAWERRNQDAFLAGYAEAAGPSPRLPSEAAARLLLVAFEQVRAARYEATPSEG